MHGGGGNKYAKYLTKCLFFPTTIKEALMRRPWQRHRVTNSHKYLTPPIALDNDHLDLCDDTKTQYHARFSHITSDPKGGADQSRPVYVPLIFFHPLLPSSLIALQLLDNANRSQANGMEQDNGAFIAA